MKFGIAITLASLFALTGLNAAAGSLTLPAFHDGMAAPKTISVETAHAHRLNSELVGVAK